MLGFEIPSYITTTKHFLLWYYYLSAREHHSGKAVINRVEGWKGIQKIVLYFSTPFR